MNDPRMIQALFQAAESGDEEQLASLLQEHPALVNAENENGLTLLGYAAHFGHPDLVKLLLEQGADVNALSHSQISFIPSNTALHAAIAGERNLDVIRLLLEHGAKTDIFDSNGHTCLHTAAFHDDNEALIELLLVHGAQLNARQEGKESPLDLAIAQGNARVEALLRRAGAKAEQVEQLPTKLESEH
ncbi:ankyrin [Brevibacillus panacihumi W25]|uniref:Ankyrin n=1 Tax=Brevibacillus panacihumi W25 TaxID=1408254 RepID=V6M6Y0_9BACL|nr:ankyrin repeat domain-containing protein [Brevibacillus panacihumi]EST54027.1 ankyrin [Brevibacillus panacihumi W25]